MAIQRLQTRPFATHIILVITLLLLNPSNLMAQQTVTFSIQQQTKEPIDAATIIISDQKTGKVIANGLTETDGKFNYTLIDGSYQLYCGAIGCRDTTILFSIPNNHSLYYQALHWGCGAEHLKSCQGWQDRILQQKCLSSHFPF